MHTPETRARALEKLKQRRADWFSENGPCVRCGSSDRLELDHVNPEEKVSHRIWSWADERRVAELAKCQPLCHECHKAKTKIQKTVTEHGTQAMYKRGCRCDGCREYKRLENGRRK